MADIIDALAKFLVPVDNKHDNLQKQWDDYLISVDIDPDVQQYVYLASPGAYDGNDGWLKKYKHIDEEMSDEDYEQHKKEVGISQPPTLELAMWALKNKRISFLIGCDQQNCFTFDNEDKYMVNSYYEKEVKEIVDPMTFHYEQLIEKQKNKLLEETIKLRNILNKFENFKQNTLYQKFMNWITQHFVIQNTDIKDKFYIKIFLSLNENFVDCCINNEYSYSRLFSSRLPKKDSNETMSFDVFKWAVNNKYIKNNDLSDSYSLPVKSKLKDDDDGWNKYCYEKYYEKYKKHYTDDEIESAYHGELTDSVIKKMFDFINTGTN